jgi:hypothetical protein
VGAELSVFQNDGRVNGSGPECPLYTGLESVQIRQQVVDLLLAEDLGVARHFVAAETNDVGDPVIIGGHPAHRQILPLEHAFHAGPLPSSRRVRRMATVAIAVINLAPRGLLRIESEFGVALAALHVTASERETHDRDTEAQNRQFRTFNSEPSADRKAIWFHLSFTAKNKPLQ